jgi:hypothetical protein
MSADYKIKAFSFLVISEFVHIFSSFHFNTLIKSMEAQTLLLAYPAQAICEWASDVSYKLANAKDTNSNNSNYRNVGKV